MEEESWEGNRHGLHQVFYSRLGSEQAPEGLRVRLECSSASR
jgi:hypothetical protein